MPSDGITSLTAGRGTDELRKLLLGGVEVVARGSGGEAEFASAPGEAENWRRIAVAPGVELHLRGDLPKMKRAEVRKLMELLERALRGTSESNVGCNGSLKDAHLGQPPLLKGLRCCAVVDYQTPGFGSDSANMG